MQSLRQWRQRASLLLLEARGRFFDWRHRVDTRGTILLDNLTVVGAHRQDAVKYQPVMGDGLAILMKCVPTVDECTFVDFGSGKGRALLLASEYPFKRIVGIEFARELHDVARQNIRRYLSSTQKCRELESINIDAAEFDLPPGPLVLFFYNPFGAIVMTKVVENIRKSLASNARDIWILCAGRWTQTGPIERIDKIEKVYTSEFYNAFHVAAS